MPDTTTTTALASFFAAGLAGSLHCIGMCGPILAGFSTAFRTQSVPLNIDPSIAKHSAPRESVFWEMAAYHAGRIWTYALLGFIAGLAGDTLRQGSQSLGVQKAVGAGLAVAVIFSGLVLLGVMPRFRKRPVPASETGTPATPSAAKRLLDMLKYGRGAATKLLLGAVMGFLPCGLVYAMLALAAALPTPMQSAAGMILFGIGTLPSLSAVLLTTNLVPARYRALGSPIAAVMLIATGAWMLTRALAVAPESCCH